MKKIIGAVGDQLQALFPPNRVMILLAAPITAASIWISALVAAHVPGVEVPSGVIAGVMGAAALITIRLIDRWFDQWQKNEPLTIDGDLREALEELEHAPASHDFAEALGAMQGVQAELVDLLDKITDTSISAKRREGFAKNSVGSLVEYIRAYLAEHIDEAPSTAAGTTPAE